MMNAHDEEKLPSGVPGLDVLKAGGIPKGRATLITGRSGTCKTVLSLQIATNLAKIGVPTAVVAVEESAADLIMTARKLGFGADELIASKKLRVLDLMPAGEGLTLVSGVFDLSGLVHLVEKLTKQDKLGAIVFDSSTALFSHGGSDIEIRAQFFQLVHAFRRLNLTAVINAEAPADFGALTTLGVEDFVCDAVIILRNVVDGERRRRSIEVHKYRRSSHYKGQFPCTITNQGLTIFPLDTQGKEKLHGDERYSSGSEGVDRLNHGGWLRDSIVLVRGPSGSGKTTLAGMFARAGAARGERVVYYGFEETKLMLMRNFETVGLPMKELEKQGMLRVECRYPEATSLEDLLIHLRVGLDEFQPSLIVLDSVSSIEHSTSAVGFRQFMIGASALLRQHGRSALMTQTVGSFAEAEVATPYLSTIPDVILQLDRRRVGTSLERTIAVVKMRGSAHETEERRFTIVPGGLDISPDQDSRG